jgi:hypothetical protein
MMHERGESDTAAVAMKPANKAEQSAAEPVEPRAGTEENADQQRTGRTQRRETVSQALARIRPLAVDTRGRSRMRESRTYGSVRGAGSNLRPYRDHWRGLLLKDQTFRLARPRPSTKPAMLATHAIEDLQVALALAHVTGLVRAAG